MKKKGNLSLGLMLLAGMAGHWWLSSDCVVRNRGMSFGWGENLGIFWIVAVAVILGWWWKRESAGKWFLIAGGLGNMFDRLRLGFVCDYWNILGSGIYNNLNDWMIFLGVLIVFWEVWRKK